MSVGYPTGFTNAVLNMALVECVFRMCVCVWNIRMIDVFEMIEKIVRNHRF